MLGILYIDKTSAILKLEIFFQVLLKELDRCHLIFKDIIFICVHKISYKLTVGINETSKH